MNSLSPVALALCAVLLLGTANTLANHRVALPRFAYSVLVVFLAGTLFPAFVLARLIDASLIEQMVQFIKENAIDVFMVDPLISFHSVGENDNSHMDLVVKQGFGAIAAQTNTAGELFHHPGKPKPPPPDPG